jgi:hypothetical protein
MRRSLFSRSAGTVLALLLAASPALPASPEPEPSMWGVVPEPLRPQAVQVVSEKLGGERVATMPAPSDGRFAFGNLAAGDYVVRLVGASGQTVAQSQVARVQPDTSVEVRFEDSQMSPAPVFGGGGGGASKALLIAGAAAIAGVGTVIAIKSDDPRPASPSR